MNPILSYNYYLSEEVERMLQDAERCLGYTKVSLTTPTIPKIFDDSDYALIPLIYGTIKNPKEFIRDTLLDAYVKLMTELDAQIKAIPDNVTNIALTAIFQVLYEFNNQIVHPLDEICAMVLKVYSDIIILYRKLSDIAKSKEEREKIKQELIKRLIEIALRLPYVADALVIIMMVDNIKTTINTLKNAKKASPKQFNSNLEKLKATAEILNTESLLASQITQTAIFLTNSLLSLISLIGGAFTSATAFDTACSERQQKATSEELKQLPSVSPSEIYRGSDIIIFAENDNNNFSYTKNKIIEKKEKHNIEEEKTNEENFCHNEIDYMNMCMNIVQPQKEENKDNVIFAKYAFIEINKHKPYKISIENNTDFKYNDKIGEINGIPIKIKLNAHVKNIQENTIFVELNESQDTTSQMNDIVSNVFNDSAAKSDAEIIVNKFTELTNVETVLREYFAYMKLPCIPTNSNFGTTSNPLPNTKDTIYKIYKIAINIALNKHQVKIKHLAGKDHVKELTETNRLIELKNEIIEEKKRYFNEIKEIYDTHLTTYNLFCKGDIKDYNLLNDYIEIYDMVEYDKENAYVMRLLRILTNFISSRYVLETESPNSLYNSFNELCDSILKPIWTYKETYFELFSNMFTTNYYTTITTSNDNINQDYKKMFDFLMNITNTQIPKTKTYNFTSLNEINSMSQSVDDYIDKDTNKKIEQIKKICKRFTLIRNIENYQEKIIDAIKYEKYTINNIKKQTALEVSSISDYYKELWDKYNELKNITDDSTFDIFKEAKITKMADVYYNGIKCNHYYVDEDDTDAVKAFNDIEKTDYYKEMQNLTCSALTEQNQQSLPYWLLYCTQATLVQLMLPMYWGCGLLVAGAPVPFPIIYIPIYFLSASVSCLFGIAICGLAIYPMIVCINFTLDAATILMPITMAMDELRNLTATMQTTTLNNLQDTIQKQIDSLKSGSTYNEDLARINIKIHELEKQNISFGQIETKIKNKKRDV